MRKKFHFLVNRMKKRRKGEIRKGRFEYIVYLVKYFQTSNGVLRCKYEAVKKGELVSFMDRKYLTKTGSIFS